jgi:hypothetical protein
MKVITIQHKNVYNKLLEEGYYRANKNFISENLIKPYEFASKEFKWDNIPIFLSPIGYHVEMYGAKSGKDYVAIEFNIPDEYVKVQEYYKWTDFIYFMEFPQQFNKNLYGFQKVEDWGKTILNVKLDDKSNIPYQAMVLELRKEWITFVLEDISNLFKKHVGVGGFNKLKYLTDYK